VLASNVLGRTSAGFYNPTASQPTNYIKAAPTLLKLFHIGPGRDMAADASVLWITSSHH
jgi:hypothetical protein